MVVACFVAPIRQGCTAYPNFAKLALHLRKALAYAQQSTRAERKRLRFYAGESLAALFSAVALQIQILAKLG